MGSSGSTPDSGIKETRFLLDTLKEATEASSGPPPCRKLEMDRFARRLPFPVEGRLDVLASASSSGMKADERLYVELMEPPVRGLRRRDGILSIKPMLSWVSGLLTVPSRLSVDWAERNW